ncbi:mitochondrial cytochrome c oxidase protein 20-like protein [Colletotrichum tofieldiae]|uniref:Cytochrome c oxidase assembly protein COX20, mitochondrial n=1 Tax=Colletotrichum tofieldiae TaxID=708197 RepID=A0A166ZC63_9PEZI|nr:mitochondrial cytochrome c oxidase protein 20-like protein [Colletotrichum tofieldiae]GKT55816.1 mitochondrial cytochrome c oxidase protein 20-like protein [Colletotrichum tofieldiae]GKT79347.1 mitochondrial cytochrome c oxidase protein 20-like protein [Colletotrichum tofieldiae]GKT82516.1 mitochondrial cytochrome c oxidase protein 20-like protein [Colletotrichum tofieldiae]
MAQDPTDNAAAAAATAAPAAPKKEGQKLYLWSRSSQGHVGEGAPGSETTTAAAAAGATPTTPEQQQKKLDPTEFQNNFPPQEGSAQQGYPSISEAVKSIKSDDFLAVTKTPCARDGFLTGIASGAGVGGLRYVMRGSPIKAANWAVGSFLVGCIGQYEYCQYLRRQERIKMKRTVEVYQETMVEKRRRELEQLKQQHEQKQQAEEAAKASHKAWYKFW